MYTELLEAALLLARLSTSNPPIRFYSSRPSPVANPLALRADDRRRGKAERGRVLGE